jgi:hypothetical protein
MGIRVGVKVCVVLVLVGAASCRSAGSPHSSSNPLAPRSLFTRTTPSHIQLSAKLVTVSKCSEHLAVTLSRASSSLETGGDAQGDDFTKPLFVANVADGVAIVHVAGSAYAVRWRSNARTSDQMAPVRGWAVLGSSSSPFSGPQDLSGYAFKDTRVEVLSRDGAVLTSAAAVPPPVPSTFVNC